jgi:hypothetical protein
MLTSLWERMGLLFLAFFLLVSISVTASFYTIETQKKTRWSSTWPAGSE